MFTLLYFSRTPLVLFLSLFFADGFRSGLVDL